MRNTLAGGRASRAGSEIPEGGRASRAGSEIPVVVKIDSLSLSKSTSSPHMVQDRPESPPRIGGRPVPSGHRLPVLGYWSIRGLGEPIRLLHALLALPLEEKVYSDPRMWAHDRTQLSTPFPNLPYYIDASGCRSESACILQHICDTHAPEMLRDSPECQQCFHYILSAHHVLRTFCYGYLPQSATRADKYRTGKTGNVHLAGRESVGSLAPPDEVLAFQEVVKDHIDQRLSLCDPFVHGETPGVCDVLLYCLVETAASIGLDPEGLAPDFVRAFRHVPEVATYLATRPPLQLPAFFVKHNAGC